MIYQLNGETLLFSLRRHQIDERTLLILRCNNLDMNGDRIEIKVISHFSQKVDITPFKTR